MIFAVTEYFGTTERNSRPRCHTRRMYSPLQFTVRRSLLDIWTCCAVTNEDPETILIAIAEGRILYAFDLRTVASGKRCLRVLSKSLHDYVNRERVNPRDDTPAKLRAAVVQLFPACADFIPAPAFARITNCSGPHVLNLIHRKFLKAAAPVRALGPTSAPRIHRASAVQFLCERRVLP